jgi:hypothetical protein
MAVTAQQVYDIALVLMDEVTDTGEILSDNPDYYKTKTLKVLTTLQAELLPSTIAPVAITDLSNTLLVSDHMALMALPYGLAAHLLLTEDVSSASYYNNRYDELKRKTQATITPITDVYSVLDGTE